MALLTLARLSRYPWKPGTKTMLVSFGGPAISLDFRVLGFDSHME